MTTDNKPVKAKAPGRRALPLRKPAFSDGCDGWEDPEFLPECLRLALLPVLTGPRRHTPQEAAEFIAACGKFVQVAIEGRRRVTFSRERDQLEDVATAARSLLKAMQVLSADAVESIEAHTVQPPGLLSRNWDVIAAFEALVREAAESVPASTKVGPDALTAAELTQLVVQTYLRRFGRLPPISQVGWFVDFMQMLGAHFGLQTGARPVRYAIEQARRELRLRPNYRQQRNSPNR